MGGSHSHIPPWESDDPKQPYSPDTVARVQHLAESSHTFLEPAPSFAGNFSLTQAQPRIEAALKADYRLANWVSKLVPRYVSEEEFWRNYWSKCQQIIDERQQSDSISTSTGTSTTGTSISATVIPKNAADGNGARVHAGGTSLSNASSQANGHSRHPPVAAPPQSQSLSLPSVRQPVPSTTPTVTRPAPATNASAAGADAGTIIRWGVIARDSARLSLLLSSFSLARNCSVTATVVLAEPTTVPLPNTAKLFHSPATLIQSAIVDAVLIDASVGSHCDLAIMAAYVKKPMLVSMPSARSHSEARAVTDLCHSQSLAAFALAPIKCEARFLSLTNSLSRIGAIHSIHYHCLSTLDTDHRTTLSLLTSPWRDSTGDGGGPVFAAASLLFLVLELLIGSVSQVYGDALPIHSQSSQSQSRHESLASCTFRCGSAVGSATFNFRAAEDRDTLEINGERGTVLLSISDPQPTWVIRIHGSETLTLPPSTQSPFESLSQSLAAYLSRVSASLTRSSSDSESDVLLTSLSSSLRSLACGDAVLRSFYRARKDEFWSRPDTWQWQLPDAAPGHTPNR